MSATSQAFENRREAKGMTPADAILIEQEDRENIQSCLNFWGDEAKTAARNRAFTRLIRRYLDSFLSPYYWDEPKEKGARAALRKRSDGLSISHGGSPIKGANLEDGVQNVLKRLLESKEPVALREALVRIDSNISKYTELCRQGQEAPPPIRETAFENYLRRMLTNSSIDVIRKEQRETLKAFKLQGNLSTSAQEKKTNSHAPASTSSMENDDSEGTAIDQMVPEVGESDQMDESAEFDAYPEKDNALHQDSGDEDLDNSADEARADDRANALLNGMGIFAGSLEYTIQSLQVVEALNDCYLRLTERARAVVDAVLDTPSGKHLKTDEGIDADIAEALDELGISLPSFRKARTRAFEALESCLRGKAAVHDYIPF